MFTHARVSMTKDRIADAYERYSLHFTMGRPFPYDGAPLPSSKLPLPMGDLDPHLIHGYLGPPESKSQRASRSVQPFLQDSRSWQTDQQTDGPRYSVLAASTYV